MVIFFMLLFPHIFPSFSLFIRDYASASKSLARHTFATQNHKQYANSNQNLFIER